MSHNGPVATSKCPPNPSLASKDPPSRLSPPPLAPLQYLQQNQRRGSITDPSLHAAPNPKHVHRDLPYSSSAYHDPSARHNSADSRPSSPYVFGDATPHLSDNTPQIRNLLRSPSLERPPRPHPLLHPEPQAQIDAGIGSIKHNEPDHMKMDVDVSESSSHSRRLGRESQPFDYSMRRHSIAVGHGIQTAHGTKRKMSGERSIFPPVGEEVDPQLVGPGIPSPLDLGNDGPAPKRRGSAFDTQRIAQLSLNDRRNSVDSRGGPWWPNSERRESTSSVFLNVNPYNSGLPGDPSHARVPSGIAAFSWPSNSQDQSGPPPTQPDTDPPTSLPPHRSFDNAAQMNMIPPLNIAPDRRMSVPDTLTSSTTTRALRPRSRPPSRQNVGANTDGASSGPDESAASPPPTHLTKDKPNPTPYSRSPELRISHKLAERKRRKEMKDLFDELRDQLPADRGMKASKWEILSKAIDFVAQLKQNHQDMAREIEMLRHELDAARQGLPFASAPHAVLYGQPPISIPGQFGAPPTPLSHPPPPLTVSRPGSSQKLTATAPPPQNGSLPRTESSPP